MVQALTIGVLALLWALGAISARVVAGGVPFFTMFAIAFGIAGGIVLIIAAIRSPLPTVKVNEFLRVFLIGVFRIFGYSLFHTAAQLNTLSGRAIAVALTSMVFMPLIEFPFSRKLPHWRFLVALVFMLAGLVCLIEPYWNVQQQRMAIILALLASVCMCASYSIDMARPQQSDTLASTGWQFIVAAICAVILSSVMEESFYPSDVSTAQFAWYAYYIFVGLILSYVIYAEIPPLTQASYSSIVIALVPTMVALIAMVVFNEYPTLMDWLGITLLSLASLVMAISVHFRTRAMQLRLARADRRSEKAP